MSDSMEEAASAALVPVREQSVSFYGDDIRAAQVAGDEIYVPLRPICEHLGLDWPSQYQRMRRDSLLQEAAVSVVITTTDRGNRPMVCLPIDLLPGWLSGVNENRVKEELREKIKRYRRECFKVLWNAFKAEIMPAERPQADLGGAELALQIAEAIASLARQQLDLERRVGDVAGRQEVMADYMRGFIHSTNERLTSLELQLSGGATISEAEAAEIALAVKNVGQRLAAQGDKNGYAKVYSEMYRRYRISSYKSIPAALYQAVLDWLHSWYEELHSSSQV